MIKYETRIVYNFQSCEFSSYYLKSNYHYDETKIINQCYSDSNVVSLNSCKQKEKISDMNILYIHHSTGGVIWQGEKASIITRAARKISTGSGRSTWRESQIAIII